MQPSIRAVYLLLPFALFLSACAAQETGGSAPTRAAATLPAPAAESLPTAAQAAAPSPVLPTETQLASDPPQPAAQATSRGDQLVASDPASVKYGNGRPVVVEFFRFTWGTCQFMAPMVHGLEAQYAGKIDFYFLDADDPATRQYQRQLGFQYQPYFVLINSAGDEMIRWNGAVPREKFEAELNKLLE